MLNCFPSRWSSKMPLRLTLGLVLCANYSCSSSKSITHRDPFLRGGKTNQIELDDPLLQGNHNAITGKGSSLNSLPLAPEHQGREMATEQMQQMQAMQQQVAQQQALVKQQEDVKAQYAALQASMPSPTTAIDPDAAKVHVAQEWPAIPEKRIGLTPPGQVEIVQGQLPPGGYEKPLSEHDAWPVPEKPATPQMAAAPANNQAPEMPAHMIQQVRHEMPAQPVRQTAAASAPDAEFTPTEPRVPTQQASMQQVSRQQPVWADPFCPPGQPPMSACPPFPGQGAACEACDPAAYPDEYLCDGGDRGLPVHYSPGLRNGLETQDTIIEYQDETGKQQMKKSNEVCVYAPRFGAVKTSTGSSENLGVDKALGAYESVNGLAMNTRMKPGTEAKTDQVNAARVRSSVSGLETEAITLGVNQATKLSDHSKLQNTNTDYAFAQTVGLDRAQTPVSMAGIQAAAVWTRKQSPVILASDVAGSELYSWFRPEEMVGLEDKSRPGRIFIDKSADRGDAQPGDIITFTIRYKNTGDRSLFNIQVIDNLTPRLEYIEGTATSDRNGQLVLEDNQEGSLILKWEISEEIKGGTGGTVTFKTRVR